MKYEEPTGKVVLFFSVEEVDAFASLIDHVDGV